MGGFGFFRRKSLPDLDEEIDLDDISLKDDKELLNELKQELEQLKVYKESKSKTTKKRKLTKLKDFTSIIEIEYFLKDVDDDFFKEHLDEIKQKIIEFIDKVLPETAISFEISLLGEKHKLLEKIHVIREVYGDLTLNRSSKKDKHTPMHLQELSKKPDIAHSLVEHNKKEMSNKEVSHLTEEKKMVLTSESDEQLKAMHILRLVEPDKRLRIGNTRIRSLEELKNYIESLPEKEFNLLILPLHKRKNISKWIEHVLGYPELSEKLMLSETREEIHSVIEEMYAKIKDIMLYGKPSESGEEELNLLEDHDVKSEESGNQGGDTQIKKGLSISSLNIEGKTEERLKKKKEEGKKSKGLKSLFVPKSEKEKTNTEETGGQSPDNKEKLEDSDIETAQQTKKTLVHILDQLPLLSEDEFAQKKDEILRALYNNKVSLEELAVFFNSSNKSEFTDALEEYLYSKPEFEKRLKSINEQKLKETVKRIGYVLGEPVESTVKESINKTTQTEVPSTQPSKQKSEIPEIKTACEEAKVGNISEKQGILTSSIPTQQMEREDSLSKLRGDRKEIVSTEPQSSEQNPLGKQMENNLTKETPSESFDQPTGSYKKAGPEQISGDDDFFNYVSKLKQELEEMKQKSSNLSVLPPPTLGDSSKEIYSEKGLLDLVKPEVEDERFVNREIISKKHELTQRVTEQGDATSYLQRQEDYKDLDKELDYAKLERELLKKEHELLQKKLELLRKRREEEQKNLNLLLDNLRLHDKLFTELTESHSKSVTALYPSKERTESVAKLTPAIDSDSEMHKKMPSLLKPLSASLKKPASQLEQSQSNEPTSKEVRTSERPLSVVEEPEIKQQILQQPELRNKEIEEVESAVSKVKELTQKVKKTDDHNVKVASEREDTKLSVKSVMDNLEEFSLNDLIDVVDEFLLNDSFNEAKQIIVEAKKLLGKRSHKKISAELRGLKELADKMKNDQKKRQIRGKDSIKTKDADLSMFSQNVIKPPASSGGGDNKKIKSEQITQPVEKNTIEEIDKKENFKAKTIKMQNQDLNTQEITKFNPNKINQVINLINKHISNNDLDQAHELIHKVGLSLKEDSSDIQD